MIILWRIWMQKWFTIEKNDVRCLLKGGVLCCFCVIIFNGKNCNCDNLMAKYLNNVINLKY